LGKELSLLVIVVNRLYLGGPYHPKVTGRFPSKKQFVLGATLPHANAWKGLKRLVWFIGTLFIIQKKKHKQKTIADILN
jgi:hypothetical protein